MRRPGQQEHKSRNTNSPQKSIPGKIFNIHHLRNNKRTKIREHNPYTSWRKTESMLVLSLIPTTLRSQTKIVNKTENTDPVS